METGTDARGCSLVVGSQSHTGQPSQNLKLIPFRLWLEHGCPWHMSSIKHACYLDEQGPVVQASACRDKPKLAPAGRYGCPVCSALADSDKFVQKVATWAYRLDHAQLLHATHCGDLSTRNVLLNHMACAQYRKCCEYPIDMQSLRDASYEALYSMAAKDILSIPKCARNQSATEFLRKWTCWLPRTKLSSPHTDLIRCQMKNLMPSTFCQKDREADMKLASLILGGVLPGSKRGTYSGFSFVGKVREGKAW